MRELHPFKWRHFQADIILLCVRWYLRYALSSRDLEEMLVERGVSVDHTSISRWVQRYAPELEKTVPTSFETHVGLLARRGDLHQGEKAVGLSLPSGRFGGKHARFLAELNQRWEAAKQFLLKTLAASHTSSPRVITVDKHAAYPQAFAALKVARPIPENGELRHVKSLNHLIEQDHQLIKRLTKPGMGFFSFETAWRTLPGFEVMTMIRKGQGQGMDKGDVKGQVALVAKLFGMAA